jgi:hypothetical protein
MNMMYLKSAKFHKLMVDADIEDPSSKSIGGKANSHKLTRKKLDLMFFTATKHKTNMNFDIFLELLPSIAEILYPGAPSLHLLLQNHLLSLQ